MTAVITESTQLKYYLEWVQDAHAMEQQSITLLTNLAERLQHYPALKARVLQHIEETEQQKALIKSIIHRYQSSNSTLKDITGKLSAFLQGLATQITDDEIVKQSVSEYAFEQFEIASYHTLISTANKVGDIEGRVIFEQILRQEEAMATWLSHHLMDITDAFLVKADLSE